MPEHILERRKIGACVYNTSSFLPGEYDIYTHIIHRMRLYYFLIIICLTYIVLINIYDTISVKILNILLTVAKKKMIEKRKEEKLLSSLATYRI